ncbi:hypothetical protein JZ751_007230 [Albula glossodonta]|uniref:Uncharacterized protein n=1 Tax=Albula glossodonta TaxID=121402 RepID=A0A8T2N2M2_9TELE|nr:hypothetical protein JZ751_007230 [Albula glossodonta]
MNFPNLHLPLPPHPNRPESQSFSSPTSLGLALRTTGEGGHRPKKSGRPPPQSRF